ncbi:hypothetical protein CEXT_788641 [Caerostris extrusa]|uniref:Uncharacterized protein n=1 Tax=Caerostris extrusa TaxID=172846 RepID=A0AAV4NRX2_CAEEX|nr:hypothetical protein CEXT_788641 [Caerostris extrusa]
MTTENHGPLKDRLPESRPETLNYINCGMQDYLYAWRGYFKSPKLGLVASQKEVSFQGKSAKTLYWCCSQTSIHCYSFHH